MSLPNYNQPPEEHFLAQLETSEETLTAPPTFRYQLRRHLLTKRSEINQAHQFPVMRLAGAIATLLILSTIAFVYLSQSRIVIPASGLPESASSENVYGLNSHKKTDDADHSADERVTQPPLVADTSNRLRESTPEPTSQIFAMPTPTANFQPTNVPVVPHVAVVTPAALVLTVAPTPPAQSPSAFYFSGSLPPFIRTQADNLSTFAIDVDTGAYSIMRSHIESGMLPPPHTVRIEEYINYFDYDYPAPEDGAFNILLEGAPSPYSEAEKAHLFRVGIQGYEVAEADRPDALLIFVIDTSGSMEQGNRLELVKSSLRLLVEELRPTDRIGIIEYGSQARVVLEPTYTTEWETLFNAVYTLTPAGSTNVDHGIGLGYAMAKQFGEAGQITRLIVASDGVANVGPTTADDILRHAREGITLSTFGFGMGNYNDHLMEQLADNGDGTYAYIDNLTEARRVFVNDLTGTLLTIAKDAKIQVEFDPSVVSEYRLLGYENRAVADSDFRNDTVDAGEIGAGHSVTALYEVIFADDASGTAATVFVRYEDPESGEVSEINEAITRAQFHTTFTDAPPSLQLTALVAHYARSLRGTPSFGPFPPALDTLIPDAQLISELWADDADVQEFYRLFLRAVAISLGEE